MGCSASAPKAAEEESAGGGGRAGGGRGTNKEESSFAKRSQASPEPRAPGEGSMRPLRQRTRASSVDFSSSGSALFREGGGSPGLDTGRAARSQAGRSSSLSFTTEGAIRVHAWVAAKDASGGARKAGRIAVTAEGNLELRTQLARHQGRHAQFTPEEAAFVLETIGAHFLFRNMSIEQQTRVIQHFERRSLKEGETLTKQGEEGARDFYIVSDGMLEVAVTKTGEDTPTVVAQVRRSSILPHILPHPCTPTLSLRERRRERRARESGAFQYVPASSHILTHPHASLRLVSPLRS